MHALFLLPLCPHLPRPFSCRPVSISRTLHTLLLYLPCPPYLGVRTFHPLSCCPVVLVHDHPAVLALCSLPMSWPPPPAFLSPACLEASWRHPAPACDDDTAARSLQRSSNHHHHRLAGSSCTVISRRLCGHRCRAGTHSEPPAGQACIQRCPAPRPLPGRWLGGPGSQPAA